MPTIENRIRNTLNEALTPEHLAVENESHKHNVPAGSESHFKVTVVSTDFEGQRLLQRHRRINSTLKAEIELIHALSLHTFTPAEWRARNETSSDTPLCLGGDRS
ncbi:MAG: BolA family protein [Pseudomonadota bacterium]